MAAGDEMGAFARFTELGRKDLERSAAEAAEIARAAGKRMTVETWDEDLWQHMLREADRPRQETPGERRHARKVVLREYRERPDIHRKADGSWAQTVHYPELHPFAPESVVDTKRR